MTFGCLCLTLTYATNEPFVNSCRESTLSFCGQPRSNINAEHQMAFMKHFAQMGLVLQDVTVHGSASSTAVSDFAHCFSVMCLFPLICMEFNVLKVFKGIFSKMCCLCLT